MCSTPITMNDVTFACRRCNSCLTTKKNSWVARAMAEKSTSRETFLLALTYENDTQSGRDGASVFRYQDIRDLMSRIRRGIFYKAFKAARDKSEGLTEKEFRKTYVLEKIRFIVAGEHGSKKGRVHWHLIIFSQTDLLSLGEWSNPFSGNKLQTYEVMWHSNGKPRKQVAWTLWNHGFSCVQEPDEGGMGYAMNYAYKDQFNAVKSQGTMRESKAENHASGYFRMSKTPPIGQDYLEQKIHTLAGLGAVPVTLELKIPDYSGFWYPSGVQRDWWLIAIYELNQCIKRRTGRQAPQMTALLATVVDQENKKEWEILSYGKEITQEDEFDDDEFQRQQGIRTREIQSAHANRTIRNECGGFFPCQRCANGFTESEVEAISAESVRLGNEQGFNTEQLDDWYRKTKKPSPYCAQGKLDRTKDAFKLFA